MRLAALDGSTLFRRSPEGLVQRARARLEVDQEIGAARFVALAGRHRCETPLGDLAPGAHALSVELPDVERDGFIAVSVEAATARFGPWEIPWQAQRKWTLYVMPTSHVDIYSTALAEQTPEEHAGVLDAAVDLCRRFPSYRFQVENALPLFEYAQLRPPGRVARLMALVRDGRIGFGAQLTGFHHAEASGEAMLQGQFLHLRHLEDRYNVGPNCGYTVDVPNATRQYVQVLARLGIEGWIFSPNRWPPPDGWYRLGEALRKLPWLSWAEAPDGSRVLLWIPREHYGEHMARFGLTGEGELETRAARMDAELRTLEAEGYPLDAFLLEYSYGDNLPPDSGLPALLQEWRRQWEYPRLLEATAGDFFAAVRSAAAGLPVVCAEFADLWAFIVANQGVLNQLDRRALAEALDAEALWALLRARGAPSWPADDVEEAFRQMARFHAHDWWYGGGQTAGIPDLAKAQFAHAARTLARAARASALAALPAAPESVDRVLVVNPSGFEVRGPVAAPAPPHAAADGVRCQLVDPATYRTHFGAEPYTIAHPPPPTPEPGPQAIFVPQAVAGLAAVAVQLRQPAASRRHEEGVIESPFYRLTFDPNTGAVTSLVDREQGRELVTAGDEGLGALLVGRPALEGFGIGFVGTREEAERRLRSSLKTWERVRLSLADGVGGPVFSSLVLRGAIGTSPVTQAVVLYQELKRVDITTTVEWANEPHVSRLVAAFPFALAPFETRYESPFATIRPGIDDGPTPGPLRLCGTWLTFQEAGFSVVVATPDTTVFSLGRADVNPLDDGWYRIPERATAYFVIAENGALSPLVQPGRLAFRFAITSGAGRLPTGDCARFGWSVLRPLIGVCGGRSRAGLRVEPASVLVTAVKPAWSGAGLVVRLLETEGSATTAVVELPFAARCAWRCDPVERPVAELVVEGGRVRAPIGAYEILTVIVEMAGEA